MTDNYISGCMIAVIFISSYFFTDLYRKAMQNPDLFGGDMMGIEDPDVRI